MVSGALCGDTFKHIPLVIVTCDLFGTGYCRIIGIRYILCRHHGHKVADSVIGITGAVSFVHIDAGEKSAVVGIVIVARHSAQAVCFL